MNRTPEALRRLYTAVAPIYDQFVPYVSSRALALARRQLHVVDRERILDVGTGTGRTLALLARANPSGWTEGLDTTPAMLTRARRRLSRCSHTRYGIRRGTATALPYPKDTFDAVFSSYTLDVLPRSQLRPALAELHRVVRPTGRLVLVYMAPPVRPIEHLWAAIARYCPAVLGGDRPLHLKSPLRETGFSISSYATRTQLGLRSAIVRAVPS